LQAPSGVRIQGRVRSSPTSGRPYAFPDYLTERLKEELMHMIGDLKEGVSNQEEFTIRAKRQGGVKQAAGALVD